MEIGPVSSARDPLQAVLDAFARLAESPSSTTGPSVLAPGFGPEDAPDGITTRATADAAEAHPDARIDKGAETGRAQLMARPQPTLSEVPRLHDAALATPAIDGATDFSLPADQRVPATLVGLQVEPAFAWPLTRQGLQPAPGRPDDDPPPRESRQPPQEQAEAEPPAPEPEAAPAPPGRPDVDADGQAWCEPLSRALRLALLNPAPPQALRAAAEQWRVGRCVVLACPQGRDPAGPAWAFILWPKPPVARGAALSLVGLRMDARLHWARLPPSVDWCHARLVKEQQAGRGRQLVALDAHGPAGVACEVQLGPVPLRTPRWRDACVRIDAALRFWRGLGDQWSVTVVVAAHPVVEGAA